MTVAGHEVVVIPGAELLAFCAGPLRPRVYVTQAARSRLAPALLEAVVEHEVAHVRRRDPLRMLMARTLADGFAFVPGLDRLAGRQLDAADLVADAAVIDAMGSAQPLAAAMLEFDDLSPRRIDELLGRSPADAPAMALACATAAMAALAAVAVTLAVARTDPAVPALVLLVLGVPAWLAARRPV
jgi:hypothetical protein